MKQFSPIYIRVLTPDSTWIGLKCEQGCIIVL